MLGKFLRRILKFLMFTSKLVQEEFVHRSCRASPLQAESFGNSWWLTRIKFRVFKLYLRVKDRFPGKCNTCVHFHVQEYFSCEFDSAVKIICLWRKAFCFISDCVPQGEHTGNAFFQTNGLARLCLRISFFILAMKMPRQNISLKSFIGTSRSSWQKSSFAWHAESFLPLDDYVSVEAGNVHWDKDCVVRQFSFLNNGYELCYIFQIRVLFLCYRLYEEAVNKARSSFCDAAYHRVEVARQHLGLKDNS